MSATALSRLNPISQFGFQVATKSNKSFFSSLSAAQRRLFSDSGRRLLRGGGAMATSGSLPVFGDAACLDDLFTACSNNGLDFAKKPSTPGGGVAFFTAASMRLWRKRREQFKNRLVCRYSSIDPLDKTPSLFGGLSKTIHTSTVCFSAHELSTSQDSELSPTTTSLK